MATDFRERRKSKRYYLRLRVYFPEFDLHGYATNISLDGCFINTVSAISEGFLTDILLELPVIGVIAMKGYVQHKGRDNDGLGVEFVQVRFEQDQSDYFGIYAQFVKILPALEEIKGEYDQMVAAGKIKELKMPDPHE